MENHGFKNPHVFYWFCNVTMSIFVEVLAKHHPKKGLNMMGRCPSTILVSSEPWKKPGCLGYIGDEQLPNYIRIIVNHYKYYKDPYLPTRIQWKVGGGFFSWLKWCCLYWGTLVFFLQSTLATPKNKQNQASQMMPASWASARCKWSYTPEN